MVRTCHTQQQAARTVDAMCCIAAITGSACCSYSCASAAAALTLSCSIATNRAQYYYCSSAAGRHPPLPTSPELQRCPPQQGRLSPPSKADCPPQQGRPSPSAGQTVPLSKADTQEETEAAHIYALVIAVLHTYRYALVTACCQRHAGAG